MKKPIVFMFSGQGSQYFNMGKELYDHHPRFKLWMDHCDEIIYPLIGKSFIDVLYKNSTKSEVFDDVLFTNPTLISIGYSLARVLMEMQIKPDYLLGYSLGEITASIISGAISLHEALEFSVSYARLLIAESPQAGMLAVIESIDVISHFPELFQQCWVTGKNFKKSFVVSGLQEDITRLQAELGEKKIITQRLPVNYGFHTELMNPLEKKFKLIASEINFYSGKIPIISALESKMLDVVNADYLWRLTRYCVEFDETIRLMLLKNDYFFVDVGASGTLSTFIKYLLPSGSKSMCFETMNQFGKNLSSINKLQEGLVNAGAITA